MGAGSFGWLEWVEVGPSFMNLAMEMELGKCCNRPRRTSWAIGMIRVDGGRVGVAIWVASRNGCTLGRGGGVVLESTI